MEQVPNKQQSSNVSTISAKKLALVLLVQTLVSVAIWGGFILYALSQIDIFGGGDLGPSPLDVFLFVTAIAPFLFGVILVIYFFRKQVKLSRIKVVLLILWPLVILAVAYGVTLFSLWYSQTQRQIAARPGVAVLQDVKQSPPVIKLVSAKKSNNGGQKNLDLEFSVANLPASVSGFEFDIWSLDGDDYYRVLGDRMMNAQNNNGQAIIKAVVGYEPTNIAVADPETIETRIVISPPNVAQYYTLQRFALPWAGATAFEQSGSQQQNPYALVLPQDYVAFKEIDSADKLVEAGSNEAKVNIAKNSKDLFCCEAPVLRIQLFPAQDSTGKISTKQFNDWLSSDFKATISAQHLVAAGNTKIAGMDAKVFKGLESIDSPYRVYIVQRSPIAWLVLTQTQQDQGLDSTIKTLRFVQ